jgi:hypothetical protein
MRKQKPKLEDMGYEWSEPDGDPIREEYAESLGLG